jgi:hypothetical protein
VRVHGDTTTPPATVRGTFTTEQLGATQLDANQWTIQYWIRRAGTSGGGSDWYWGTGTYDNHIDGFAWSIAGNPLDHNTISWTKSADDGAGSDDVLNYKIYRADNAAGPWTTLVATVSAGTTSYVDLSRGLNDGTIWWYVVRATDITGNTETNTNAAQEPGGVLPEAYDIDLTGKTAGQWVFVSFPIAITGSIQTILNDAQTTWDVAKWYNGQTKVWTSYRATGTQTIPTMTNQMGVWLHLTANAGDFMLTTATTGLYPTAAVNINLYAGWNMVGYPSATARLGSATLPVEATAVSVWQAGTPYISDSTPGAVTMTEGNAYWVQVSADCVWTVQP